MTNVKKIVWQLFPKNIECPNHLEKIISIFDDHFNNISSFKYQYKSNVVLEEARLDLESFGYQVEKSKAVRDKISVPVLFGRNGKLEKWFDADAYSQEHKTVIEVEAGRAFSNYQFLKDLFEACVMSNVNYCVIAVRQIYRQSKDFEKVIQFLETLYASDKLVLPLKGVLILGY